MMTLLLRNYYKLIGKGPADMPMVSYWKTSDHVQAKVTRNKEGAIVMKMDGEKYPFPGFPRGHLLYGKLSKLKHEIKNQVFNQSWAKLEVGEEIASTLKSEVFPRIFDLAEETKYDMVPYTRMVSSVKEIYRAWTKVAPSEKSLKLRDILTFILQEDDSYRFRVQWLVTYFNPNKWYMKLFGDPIKQFEKALGFLEHAEVISDMKERIRLLRRVLLAVLKDEDIKQNFLAFCKEVDWKKVGLSEADKYHFRGKYFRVDYAVMEY